MHLSERKNIITRFSDQRLLLLPPLSQLRFLFTNKLSASSIVVLCNDQKFVNVSHEKIDIKMANFPKIESKSIENKAESWPH